ncbi:FkbM family methyltransferase [Candidatus Sumerlaeota bacterium]|nr:FkbM family methyltransferase [Candidatus Sumerlaeota bacterium]
MTATLDESVAEALFPKRSFLTKLRRKLRHTIHPRNILWHIRRWSSPNQPFIVSMDGDLRVRIYPTDVIGECLYLDDVFEPIESRFVCGFLRPGMIVFDIGANSGYYTLLACKRVGPTGSVHSFELSSRMVAELRFNVQLNGFSNVHINPKAVGDKPGVARLSRYAAGKEAYGSLGQSEWPGERIIGYDEVKVTTVDEYVRNARVEHVDLVKMDVEGGELLVLKGGTALFSRSDAPAVLFEFGPAMTAGFGYEADEILQLLRRFGYVINCISARGGLVVLPASIPAAELPAGNLVATKRHVDGPPVTRLEQDRA